VSSTGLREDDHSVVVGSGSVDRRPGIVYVSDLGVGNSQQSAEDEFVQDLGVERGTARRATAPIRPRRTSGRCVLTEDWIGSAGCGEAIGRLVGWTTWNVLFVDGQRRGVVGNCHVVAAPSGEEVAGG
jgi:hypothetical protein